MNKHTKENEHTHKIDWDHLKNRKSKLTMKYLKKC